MERTVTTAFGEVTLRGAMIDLNGTDLVDGVEVKIDGELIGEVLNTTFGQVEDLSEVEVELFLIENKLV